MSTTDHNDSDKPNDSGNPIDSEHPDQSENLDPSSLDLQRQGPPHEVNICSGNSGPEIPKNSHDKNPLLSDVDLDKISDGDYRVVRSLLKSTSNWNRRNIHFSDRESDEVDAELLPCFKELANQEFFRGQTRTLRLSGRDSEVDTKAIRLIKELQDQETSRGKPPRSNGHDSNEADAGVRPFFEGLEELESQNASRGRVICISDHNSGDQEESGGQEEADQQGDKPEEADKKGEKQGEAHKQGRKRKEVDKQEAGQGPEWMAALAKWIGRPWFPRPRSQHRKRD
ncbi:uncharacterized protein PV06_08358 [Exophiala oligosperma]|uniref:Uncharacterized protein n=1 Tax=Exophiala oligosperma TaxID=215243 RepID=A0A0D2D9H6_9EURO|nr:uncharacterized protein PV06_08358 [Exophiala oligosperma]KIW39773.1 hypothetical protein PV06_08358 [Exophiala oligosperma]